VTIGDDCRLGPHVYVTGHTRIGAGTVIHQGAVIGDEPQDLHYDAEESYTQVGTKCVIREYVTIHRGVMPGSITMVGNGVMLMGMVHVAHNCQIADNVIVANATLLAGHVQIGYRAFLSGAVGVHQFVRIGSMAMVGGMEKVTQDVPPFSVQVGGLVRGANTIGLRRAGVSAEARQAIRGALKLYYRHGLNRQNAVACIEEQYGTVVEVRELVRFIETTKRGLAPGRPEDEDPSESGDEAPSAADPAANRG
jgi:UDP-N-acetylglucosamine acyltransferase